MGRTLALLEAEANLSKIAEEVNRTGERVTLTKEGEPWVDLVRHETAPEAPRRSKAEVMADIDALRATLKPTTIDEILSAIREGRR